MVVVLADDLGFSDIGCFGSEIPTPQDDALHFEQNQFGTPRRFGPVPLPGESTRLEMNVDGEEALAVRGLPRFRGFPPFEGIDVGVCRRSPVSWELYRRRRGFPFTGVLRSVTYRPDPDTAAQLVGRLEQVRRLG